MGSSLSLDSLSRYSYDTSSSRYRLEGEDYSEEDFNSLLGSHGVSAVAGAGTLYSTSDYSVIDPARIRLGTGNDPSVRPAPLGDGESSVSADQVLAASDVLGMLGYTVFTTGREGGLGSELSVDIVALYVMFEIAKTDTNINFKLNNALDQAKLALKNAQIEVEKEKIKEQQKEATAKLITACVAAGVAMGVSFAASTAFAKEAIKTSMTLQSLGQTIGTVVNTAGEAVLWSGGLSNANHSKRIADLGVLKQQLEREETALGQISDSVSSGQNEAREQMKKLIQMVADLMQLNTQAVNMTR